MEPRKLSRDEARAFLVGHHGLNRFHGRGAATLPPLLRRLRCIQLDPLDPMGTNADLVALARVQGLRRGDVYSALFPGHAFEHFAKERCLLPAEAFPWYRRRASETPWWRLGERLKRLSSTLIETVLDEIRRKGPISAEALEHRGKVDPLDWNGWKGTASATRMALEVLWTRCEIVVCGRAGRSKLFDVPERALPHFAVEAPGQFEAWALTQRVEAAGLLARAGGPTWSMLTHVRTTGIIDEALGDGALEEVVVEGASRRYLAPAGFAERAYPRFDDNVRVLGPLDPLIWDRGLIKHVFGFDYVWEVYKPASVRRWGWYVCPLLHRDRLIGRVEGVIADGALRVGKLWREDEAWSDDLVDEALARHAKACGVDRVIRKRAIKVSPGKSARIR